jgi:GTPase
MNHDITHTVVPIELINMGQENDEGNIEYKYKLTNLDPEKFEKRLTQMKFRIYEGGGEALYWIGLMDNGTPKGLEESEYIESVNNLKLIASKLGCSITKLLESSQSLLSSNTFIGEFLIRETHDNNYVDLKICVAGNVDAGKSTTIGTLTKGILDDGRGKARTHVFNYRHEIETGRTSSIGHQILGFDSNGDVVNSKFDRHQTWSEIVNQSDKIVSFFDLAGHEKYLRTTIYGLTSMCPDYCLIMIGANMGISNMTREHIGLCLTLKIPFIIIVSKIDIVPVNILEENMKKINSICKNGAKKVPYHIKSKTDIIHVIKNIKSDNIVPIIQISNVNSHNLDLLKMLLNLLPIRNDYTENITKPVELLIDNKYSVTGHPIIISGLLRSGIIKINDTLAIGPFYDGSYKQVKVKSIHCKYKDVREARAGSYICISLKNISRREIRKGMVLIGDILSSKIALYEFWAQINILHSPTTIKIGYQPFVHIDQVRQCVKISDIIKINSAKIEQSNIDQTDLDVESNKVLRTGDKAYVKLVFVSKPEYIKPMMKLIFREGKVKAIGKIIESKDLESI